MSKYQIICVDDDKDVLETIQDIIQRTEYEPVGFLDPRKATEYIQQNRNHIILILSDLRMDDVNGFEFKKGLSKESQAIPFTIITGYWTPEMSAEAMALGIDTFLEKPLRADVLTEQIEKFAKERQLLLDEEREMVEGFLEESSPMLDEIESLILELEESSDKEQPLAVYFRLLHTIKGTASCVGLTKLGDFTHKYEDFIGELRNHKFAVDTDSINVLLGGLDDLKVFFSEVEQAGHDQHLNFEDQIKKFVDFVPGQTVTKSDDSVESSSRDSKQVVEKADKSEDDKMTVSLGLLNQFMEESGELTVIRNSILKTVKKIENRYRGDDDIEQLNELLMGMYSVTANIQGKITEMRKVSLKNTFRPFKRLIRDLSKKLDKEVDLILEGEELLVDNVIAKLFSNTMIHLLRNSLDHGIETKADRLAVGKESAGRLEIKAYADGEDIVLKIVDDGKGIDPEIISRLALEKGLYTESELQDMSQIQIINIIFDSGFSTAETVSDLSGRGVGMDMVRGSFRDLGGEVYVQSEKGVGSTFTLQVPIPKSVLIINTLSVSSDGKILLFQMDEVVEVLRYESENNTTKLFDMEGEKILNHNGEMIDLVCLSKVLDGKDVENPDLNVVVLRVGSRKFGVIVDQIFEFEEVVLRKISNQIQSKNLYHGASLVGAGEVAMILSAEGIAEQLGISLVNDQKDVLADFVDGAQREERQEFMLFKYNDEESLCIALDRVDRFEKIKTKDIEDIGGQFIVRYNESNLVMVDPGFALGLEGQSVLGKESLSSRDEFDVIVVALENSFLGIIVHELGEISCSEQEMNTETVDIPGLLGALFINGKTVCAIDVDFITLKSRESYKEKLEFNLPTTTAA